MRVRAPAEGKPGQRRRRSLRKKMARWRPRNIRQVSFFGWPIKPDRANSANSPRHPVNLCICTRLAFHLWVFSLLICSVRLGRWARSRQKCANPKGSVFFIMVHARGAPQVRGDAMRRRRAARNATSTTTRIYFSLGRVVKCADAAHCDARRPEIAFFSSAREPVFRFWACCAGTKMKKTPLYSAICMAERRAGSGGTSAGTKALFHSRDDAPLAAAANSARRRWRRALRFPI